MKKITHYILTACLITFFACDNASNQTESTEEETVATTEEAVEATEDASTEVAPRVFFTNLTDGDTVSGPVVITFGVEGMGIEPAGEVHEGFRHHHLLINQAFVPVGQIVPANETSIHYGQGQTDTGEITLPAGNHTLTLQFANGAHASYGEAMSTTLNITVE